MTTKEIFKKILIFIGYCTCMGSGLGSFFGFCIAFGTVLKDYEEMVLLIIALPGIAITLTIGFFCFASYFKKKIGDL